MQDTESRAEIRVGGKLPRDLIEELDEIFLLGGRELP
jgi:hypothetical protein